MRFYLPILAAGALAAGACADNAAPTSSLGDKPLNFTFAPLQLDGVKDAIWDIQVKNENNETVFQTRITSSGYGNGAGAASYVGTCDAQTTGTNEQETGSENPDYQWNKVSVWLVGVYDAKFDGTLGTFSQTDGVNTPAGVPSDQTAEIIQNPGQLTKFVKCAQNEDTFVDFNVAVMRPANQGFFDIAVNFNNVFCSAKYDCASGDLLHDGGTAASRETTQVLGIACTSGDGLLNSELLMDNVVIDCGNGADVTTIDTRADGNLCSSPTDVADGATVHASGGTACGNISYSGTSTNGATPIFQAAVYRGQEASATGQGVVYWNVALGIKDDAGTGALATCKLSVDVTVDNGSSRTLTNNAIAQGQVYPFIDVTIPNISTCTAEHQLNACLDGSTSNYPACDGQDEGGKSGVNTVYTTTTSGPNFGHLAFPNVYNPAP